MKPYRSGMVSVESLLVIAVSAMILMGLAQHWKTQTHPQTAQMAAVVIGEKDELRSETNFDIRRGQPQPVSNPSDLSANNSDRDQYFKDKENDILNNIKAARERLEQASKKPDPLLEKLFGLDSENKSEYLAGIRHIAERFAAMEAQLKSSGMKMIPNPELPAVATADVFVHPFPDVLGTDPQSNEVEYNPSALFGSEVSERERTWVLTHELSHITEYEGRGTADYAYYNTSSETGFIARRTPLAIRANKYFPKIFPAPKGSVYELDTKEQRQKLLHNADSYAAYADAASHGGFQGVPAAPTSD